MHINEALESSRNEVQRLHAERDQYEETMKKAFMRGVCALNLEAMSMFHENEGNTENQAPNDNQGFAASAAEAASFTEHTAPQQCAPRTITSQAAVTASTLTHTVSGSVARKSAVPKTTSSGKGTRTITAKVTARPDTMRTGQASLSGVGLAPPMSSVLVERHHPVTQQTIGHATASRYPRQQQMQSSGSGVAQRKIAGQTSNKINLASPNIQTVKVVQ
ncbi:centrosomal protein POC5-like [Saccoglossus kowalevskii]|uniref:Centrosomal protein POC5 n=1 Tax=Saccoglossus kowalevskii TaxID=10224 RepID=A0ABM0GRM0_SACKO|nr:PREDICTED: centrosomal protein POC5-like [Saccoglossus kowalevskii]